MRTRRSVLALAVLAAAPAIAHGAVTWTYDGTTSNSWGSATSWSTSPLFDGTEDVIFDASRISATSGANSIRTLTIDADRYLNSLSAVASSVTANRKYVVNPGVGGIIKLKTGNLSIDGNGASSANPLNLSNTTVQIGDGTTPVTSATWNFVNSGTKAGFAVGAIKGIAGTIVSLTGDNGSIWSGSSSNFLGELRINQNFAYTTSGIKTEIRSSNALGGTGSLVVANAIDNGVGATNLHFNSDPAAAEAQATSHAMNLRLDVNTSVAVGKGSFGGSLYPGFVAKATINGNVTGNPTTLEIGSFASIGSTGYPWGTLVLNGGANTLSSNVNVKMGRLQVDGTWTGAGTITVNRGMLAGSGTIGLAPTKKISIAATGSNDDQDPDWSELQASIAPGEAGVVGTLTVGTSGNLVEFLNAGQITSPSTQQRRTQFLVDISGTTADRLTVNGDVTIGNTNTYLVFNQLSAPTAGPYVLMSWTGSLTGTFANVENQPAGSTLTYDLANKQLVLSVPEPGSAAGLFGVAGLVALRRRRRM